MSLLVYPPPPLDYGKRSKWADKYVHGKTGSSDSKVMDISVTRFFSSIYVIPKVTDPKD